MNDIESRILKNQNVILATLQLLIYNSMGQGILSEASKRAINNAIADTLMVLQEPPDPDEPVAGTA